MKPIVGELLFICPFISIQQEAQQEQGFETFRYSTATTTYQNNIHTEILKVIDMKDRGKKTAKFHVLKETMMPAVLTENGFINNPADAAKMKDDAWIEKVARGHINGLEKALRLKKKENNAVSELNESQEKVRQEAIQLGITDGKNPFTSVNQFYVWSSMLPLARKVKELENKLKA